MAPQTPSQRNLLLVILLGGMVLLLGLDPSLHVPGPWALMAGGLLALVSNRRRTLGRSSGHRSGSTRPRIPVPPRPPAPPTPSSPPEDSPPEDSP